MAKEKDIFDEMFDSWGNKIVPRKKIGEFTGGLYSPGYMANLDSRGEGVPGGFYLGRQFVYPTESLTAWLRGRSSFRCERAS